MKARIVIVGLVTLLFATLPATAGGKDDIQKYFSSTSNKVKAASSVVEKRAILHSSLRNMITTLDIVTTVPTVSAGDRIGISRFRGTLQAKQDELTGTNGYDRVTDVQLDAFSEYVVQDMEQAEVITISIVTLLLIIILVVLIAR